VARLRPQLLDQHGRPMAATFATASGGYDSGANARRLRGWSTWGSGPNASYWRDLRTIRSRSRHAVRNSSYAQAAVRSFVGNAVGTGIVPRWKLEDQALSERITSLWERWVDQADADGMVDFYGLQGLVARTVFTSGEALVRLRSRRLSDGLEVPLQLQVLEPDYLDESRHEDTTDGRHRRMGIEFDGVGRRRAYWLHRAHPGDLLAMSTTSQPVPADQVIHVYRVDRPGQIRGVPWLAGALLRLRQLEEYEDAELVRKKTAAFFAGFVRTAPGDMEGPDLGVRSEESLDFDSGEITLEPGTLSYLKPGEDIQFSEPADVGGSFEAFVRQQLRAIATTIGVTYEQLTGDLTGVNYSSIRAGLLEFRRWVEEFQHNLLIFQLCRRVAHTWLDFAFSAGALDLPGYRNDPRPYQQIEWRPPGWEWVDPQKDINAKIMAINAGLESREAVVASRGYHVEDVDAANARDVERARELGLQYTTDVAGGREGGPPSVQSSRRESDGDDDADEVEDR